MNGCKAKRVDIPANIMAMIESSPAMRTCWCDAEIAIVAECARRNISAKRISMILAKAGYHRSSGSCLSKIEQSGLREKGGAA